MAGGDHGRGGGLAGVELNGATRIGFGRRLVLRLAGEAPHLKGEELDPVVTGIHAGDEVSGGCGSGIDGSADAGD